ncbi:MAG: UbiA family prenyltransferase [Sphingobium sp.]|uniref:UbiA family prenyltransferase n=1 Tax=Sphingobium sp. TaxID=1912891 RepID=UPI0029B14F62|nr:UbiA family prenyltransferase [Sphingobium sp.]MDX3909589.1 UbiA family prenyltransferase [Sphingobium sp.]
MGVESRVLSAQSSPQTALAPLIVDLDQTLVRTDTLHENLTEVAFRQPLKLPGACLQLLRGRAAMKRRLTEIAPVDCTTLPYDQAVLDLIERRKMAGGEVHLVTAADQSIADGVSKALGLFDSATGSNGVDNLKSVAKAESLASRFTDGFDYVGDSAADLPVWRHGGEAIIAGGARGLQRRVEKDGIGSTLLPRRRANARQWVKALRLHQWSKNLLLFAPLMLAHEYLQPELLGRVVLAWLFFGIVASSTYLINDLSDLAADRQHPTKRFRALAAGLIPISRAVPLIAVMLIGGLVGAWLLHASFGLVLSAYTGLTLLYSLQLKSKPMIDVAAIATLFALRITAGMVVIDHPVSLWLVAFTSVLFLSLALAKRTAELVQAARNARVVKGRGYLPGDEPLTLALGIASGMVSVLVMVLYLSLDAMPTGLYAQKGPLFLIPAVLGLWLMRIWLLAHRGTLNDDPVVYAIRDKGSWLHAAAVAALWAFAVGVPQ